MSSNESAKSFTRVAVAVVIAAIVVSAAALSYASFESTVTKTEVSVSTSTLNVFYTTTTTTTVVTSSNATTPLASGRLYEVVFKQSGACSPTAYAAPWSVTLGPWTVAEPSNASLPISTSNGSAGPYYVNESTIAFSVPNGDYQYRIAVGWGFGNPTGNVTVDGSDITVLLEGPFISCTSTVNA
jgi:hypothetical protein